MTTLLLWGCLLSVVGQPGDGNPSRTPSMEEVVSHLAKRESLTFGSESLHIKCSWGSTDHTLLGEADEDRLLKMLQRSDFDPRAFPRQTIMRTPGYRYELGKKGTKLFQRVVNPLDLKFGEEGLTGAFDGSIGVELMQRDHATIGKEPPSYSWQNWEYAFLQNLDILKYVKEFNRNRIPVAIRPIGFPDDIIKSSDYRIVGGNTLNGSACLILDKADSKRFWLDPAMGYAVKRVDSFVAGKQRGLGSLKSSVVMTDFREARTGLWLPWSITEELYFDIERGPSDMLGKPAVRRTLSVEAIEFDKLTDNFFEVPVPVNAMVHDNIRHIQYRNQKEGVPFALAIDYARQHPGQRSWGKHLLILANLLLVCIIGWFYLFRRPAKTVDS